MTRIHKLTPDEIEMRDTDKTLIVRASNAGIGNAAIASAFRRTEAVIASILVEFQPAPSDIAAETDRCRQIVAARDAGLTPAMIARRLRFSNQEVWSTLAVERLIAGLPKS